MNKRKIFILLVLLIAVVGFTMGQACAATTTIKVGKYKDVGKKDRILTF
jgi:ABC-type lipoprotein release transport system permease subunit